MLEKVYRKISSEAACWGLFLLKNLPGSVGVSLRSFIYKRLLRSCGSKPVIQEGCDIKGFKNIVFGDNILVGLNSQIYAFGKGKGFVEMKDGSGLNSNVMVNANEGGSIVIGKRVIVGPNVMMRASDHKFGDSNKPIKEQGHRPGHIVIEDDAWICANVVILKDVVIGRGAIVGAGAVVTKNVEPFSIVAGVPAKVISRRNQNE